MAFWDPTGQNEPSGTLSNAEMIIGPMMYSANTMGAGFIPGKYPYNLGTGYLAGHAPNVSVARRMTGQSFMNQKYSNFLARGGPGSGWLSQNIPTLNQLSVGRHITFMSGVGGQAGSIQTMTGAMNIEKMAINAQRTLGVSYQEGLNTVFGKSQGTTLRAMGAAPFRNLTFANEAVTNNMDFRYAMRQSVMGHTPPVTWNEALGGSTYNQGLGQANARFAARMGSINEEIMSGLYNTPADKARRKIAVRSMGYATGEMRSPMGRAAVALTERAAASESIYAMMALRAPSMAANIGGKAFAQYTAFTLSELGGHLAGKAFKGAIQIPGNMYMSAMKDIHRGTFISSAPLSPFVGATGRQRAIADIYYKQLNLSQALGNEAAYLMR